MSYEWKLGSLESWKLRILEARIEIDKRKKKQILNLNIELNKGQESTFQGPVRGQISMDPKNLLSLP
ncbi:MAG: hypothetical protein ACP5E3_16295 [Bacteroidales bacterium]